MSWDVNRLLMLNEERDQIESSIHAEVRFQRENGCPWSLIGEALGVTKQAAQQRYGRPVPNPWAQPGGDDPEPTSER